MIATVAFQPLAVGQLQALGLGGLPLLVIDHPLGGEKPEGVRRRARQAVEELGALVGASR